MNDDQQCAKPGSNVPCKYCAACKYCAGEITLGAELTGDPPPNERRTEMAREQQLGQALREMLDAISKRWDGETEKKRSNGVSPRMEEAIAAARVALLMRDGEV
jgi:hypothetical protein